MMFECIDKIYPSVSIDTVTGSICNFTDNIGDLPLKSCSSLISGYQEGSGTPSPQNERPLHAFSSGTLTDNGNTYTFTFGQSIYQGYIDWKRGVLTIDTGKMVAKNDGNWRFEIAGGLYNYVYYRSIIISDDFTKLLSNVAPTVNQSTDLGITRANLGFIQMYVNELGITSLADWNTYITNNNIEIAYPLATPIEIPLGGINLLTQEGQNNIFCDTGDTTVKYIKIV